MIPLTHLRGDILEALVNLLKVLEHGLQHVIGDDGIQDRFIPVFALMDIEKGNLFAGIIDFLLGHWHL